MPPQEVIAPAVLPTVPSPVSPPVSPPISPGSPWLAPLAGYSDLPFRLLCREMGAAAACTEMISAKGLVYKSPGTEPLLATCPADSPLVVQLFGAEPEFMAKAMDLLLNRGFAHYDLNCGCSVPKVVKTGSGAALLQDPDRLLALARVMIERAGAGKVGFKLRLGWALGQEVYLDVARRLEDLGAGWVTLHPRHARQGFSGRARWEAFPELKRAVTIPVIASGDLLSARAAREVLALGVDGVMLARGAMFDPAIFARLAGRLDELLPHTGPFLARLVRRHAELARMHGSEGSALFKMRTIVPGYIKALPGSGELRKSLVACRSWETLEEIMVRLEQAAPVPCSPLREPSPISKNES